MVRKTGGYTYKERCILTKTTGTINFQPSILTMILKLTSAGTMGALTAVAASSPFKAPTTASAISMATPSCRFLKILISNK